MDEGSVLSLREGAISADVYSCILEKPANVVNVPLLLLKGPVTQ